MSKKSSTLEAAAVVLEPVAVPAEIVEKETVDIKASDNGSTPEVKVDAVVKTIFPPISQDSNGRNLARDIFMWGMIAVDVFRFRNVIRDTAFYTLAEQIRSETGRTDGEFPLFYAELVTYTDAMYFSFSDEVPDEYRSLETWWAMVTSGISASECYLWYIENVPNIVHNLYHDAFERCQKVWKPAVEKAKATPEELVKNPN